MCSCCPCRRSLVAAFVFLLLLGVVYVITFSMPWYTFVWYDPAGGHGCEDLKKVTYFWWSGEHTRFRCASSSNSFSVEDNLSKEGFSPKLQSLYRFIFWLLVSACSLAAIMLIGVSILMLGVRPKRERICRLILLGICFLQLACLGLSITYFTGRHSNAARDDFKSGEMSSTIPCQDYWCDSFAGTEKHCFMQDDTCYWGPFLGWYASCAALLLNTVLIFLLACSTSRRRYHYDVVLG